MLKKSTKGFLIRCIIGEWLLYFLLILLVCGGVLFWDCGGFLFWVVEGFFYFGFVRGSYFWFVRFFILSLLVESCIFVVVGFYFCLFWVWVLIGKIEKKSSEGRMREGIGRWEIWSVRGRNIFVWVFRNIVFYWRRWMCRGILFFLSLLSLLEE